MNQLLEFEQYVAGTKAKYVGVWQNFYDQEVAWKLCHPRVLSQSTRIEPFTDRERDLSERYIQTVAQKCKEEIESLVVKVREELSRQQQALAKGENQEQSPKVENPDLLKFFKSQIEELYERLNKIITMSRQLSNHRTYSTLQAQEAYVLPSL